MIPISAKKRDCSTTREQHHSCTRICPTTRTHIDAELTAQMGSDVHGELELLAIHMETPTTLVVSSMASADRSLTHAAP